MTKITYIPGEIANAAIDEHGNRKPVTRTQHIFDDTEGKSQAEVNADTYRKNEVYNKEETNNIISRTPETDVVVLDVPEGGTASDALNAIPVADRPNKLFRVRNDANTKYDEYGWTGTVWALLASKDYGIDDDPVEESDNIIKSGAVAKYIKSFDGNKIRFAFTDKFGNIISYIDSDEDILKFLLNIACKNIDVETFNGINAPFIISDDNYKIALTDSNYNLIVGIDKDDKIINGLKDNNVQDSYEQKYSTYLKNIDGEQYALNDCKYGTPNQLFQCLVVTDTHKNLQSWNNAIDVANNINSIQCLIHLGDTEETANFNPDIEEDFVSYINNANKPVYIAIGNHDTSSIVVDGGTPIRKARDNDMVFEHFILPIINKGWLSEGEYEYGKSYYYHDFPIFNTRIVVLYPYETPCTIDTSLWQPIDFDSSYQLITEKKIYTNGEKVNIPNYTKYSFEAVTTVDVSNSANEPKYKEFRAFAWYSSEQLQWLCETLDAAGELGYDVIICQHYRIMGDNHYIPDMNTRFHNYKIDTVPAGYYRLEDNDDVLSALINAYITRGSINMTIVPQPITYNGHTEDISNMVAANIEYTFSNTGKVICLNGHNHTDTVLRHKEYNITNIGFLSGKVQNFSTKDIYRSISEYSNWDALTTVTLDSVNRKIHLTRIGAAITDRINVSTGELYNKKNEIITF